MVVRMRHTRAHTANRRSHHKVEQSTLTKDAKSGVVHIRHRVSLEDGRYRGRQVIDIVKATTKKTKKTA